MTRTRNWSKCILAVAWVTLAYALPTVANIPSIHSLIKRSPSNPVGWRGEWFLLLIGESSAPPLSRPGDWYESEGEPDWLTFHSTNRSWTGWVPSEGPDDEKLQFRLSGKVQNQDILQQMDITLTKRPTRSLPVARAIVSLSPEFFNPSFLPTEEMVPNAPSILSRQLSSVFMPSINVSEIALAEMVQSPSSENDTAIEVSDLMVNYNGKIHWTAPSKSTKWKLFRGEVPPWLKYEPELGVLSGTVPPASSLSMAEARDLKRGAIQVSFTAESKPLAIGDYTPKETQVVVIRSEKSNNRPELNNPTTRQDRIISTKSVTSGSSLEWNMSPDWVRDGDGDSVVWVCAQSALGLPPWARWDANTGTMKGRVPQANNSIADNAGMVDWANVSLPLRGSMPESKQWSPSSSFWVTVMDPLGGLADWKRADLVVDDRKPPIPLKPKFDLPKPSDPSSTISVRLNELFDISVQSVLEWDGFVGIIPAHQPITLDVNGALIVDPVGKNRDVVAQVVLVDSDGATGITTVSFPKLEQLDSPNPPASTEQTRDPDLGNSNNNNNNPSESNKKGSMISQLFESIDTSSVDSFLSSAKDNIAVQVISGTVLCLMCSLVVSMVIFSRQRRIQRDHDILNQIQQLRTQPSEPSGNGTITIVPMAPLKQNPFDSPPPKVLLGPSKDFVPVSHDGRDIYHESQIQFNHVSTEFGHYGQEYNTIQLQHTDAPTNYYTNVEAIQQHGYPPPYLPPNPSATDVTLANAWIAMCPDHYIAQSPTASTCTMSQYSIKRESENPPGHTMPRLSVANSPSFIDPPPDMPHAVAVYGQPFSYLHPDVWTDYQANNEQPGLVRYGLVSGHHRRNVPQWISIDPITGGIAGIPMASEVGLATVLAIVRWEVRDIDYNRTNQMYPQHATIPQDAVEIARFWVNVSDLPVPGNRDTLLEDDAPAAPISHLISKFQHNANPSASTRTTELIQEQMSSFNDDCLSDSTEPASEHSRNTSVVRPQIDSGQEQLRRRQRRSSLGSGPMEYMNQKLGSGQYAHKRQSSLGYYDRASQRMSIFESDAWDRKRFDAWLRGSSSRDTMDMELNRV